MGIRKIKKLLNNRGTNTIKKNKNFKYKLIKKKWKI